MSEPLALIIEDHEDHSIIFKNAFTMAGFETEVVEDGLAARERLAQVVPVVITLDLHLPKVSGETLLREICADERFADTHIVILTGDETLAQDRVRGADQILVKPVSFTYLRDIAKTLYGRFT